MYKRTGIYSRHISWLYLFLSGFLMGILMINIWKSTFFGEMDLLGTASLNRLKYLDINGRTFLLYILKGRFKTMLLLCTLATTYAGILSVSIYAGFMGVMAGIFLSTAAMRYGIKGVFLIMTGIFPQYLLLVPAYLILMRWCWQVCAGLYYPHKVYESGYGMRGQYYRKKLLQLLIIIVAVFIGSLIESSINPVLMSQFLKVF